MFFKSLIIRVILLNILLMAIGIGLFALVNARREQTHLLESSLANAELLLSTIEKSIYTAMRNGNSAEVQTILEMVGHSRQLVGVRIFHPDGIVLKSANPREIGKRVNSFDLGLFQRDRTDGISRFGERETLSLVRPIVTDERCYLCHGVGRRVVGILNINLDLSENTQQLNESSSDAFISMLVMIAFFSAGISFILLRFVRQPIQEMAQKMSKVESGDLSVRLEPRNSDEVGRLMRSFNSMVDNLENAKQELEQYHYQQMERADRLASVGEMATGIAHEIKNPLTCISSAISVLADDFDEQDPRREIIAKVLEQIGRLDKTAADLLFFGKPGKPEFTFVDVNELLKKTFFFVSQHPEARNIHRAHELTRDLPPVWVDEKQIQQVFFNIIINAVQAMKNGGTLSIQTDLTERNGIDYVRITIQDTGAGIPPEDLEKIFVPFFTTKTQGTGLGLPICRQLLEQHGGIIEVTSQINSGTTFFILLPAGCLPRENQGDIERAQTQDSGR